MPTSRVQILDGAGVIAARETARERPAGNRR